MEGGEGVEGFRVVTAVGEKRIGRMVEAEGTTTSSSARSAAVATRCPSVKPRLIRSDGGC